MLGALIGGAIGLGQTILGGLKQNKAIKQLEKMQSPTYTQNKTITDFYNKSLEKYKVNTYNTDLYRMQEQQANRGLASGLGALSGRGMALAGVNNLVQGRNDAMLRAGAAAEQAQGQNLNRLGQAAGMKTAEDQRAFEINQMQPFERKYNLLAMKAGGGAQTANAGINNIFNAAQSYDQMRMTDNIFGKSSGSQFDASYINPSSVLNSLYKNQRTRVQ